MPVTIPTPSKPPSFRPIWRKPKRLIEAWPPRDSRGHHDVKDADNWSTVAVSHGFPDPWDLIIFNFRTDVPEEVNWYLHHFIGCRHSTDGKNFSFKGAEFRRVYLPPPNWIPDRDYRRGSFNYRFLTRSVIRDLEQLIPQLKALRYRRFAITPFQFREVLEDLRSGRLSVRLETEPSGSNGWFDQDGVHLTRYGPGDYRGKMDLIHELTHAILERDTAATRHLDEEVLARTLEAIFLYAREGQKIERNIGVIRSRLTSLDNHAYFFLGWVIHKHFHRSPFIDLHALNRTFHDPFLQIEDNPVDRMERTVILNPGYMLKWWLPAR